MGSIDERVAVIEHAMEALEQQRCEAEKRLNCWRMGATAALVGVFLLWPEVSSAVPPPQVLEDRIDALEELLANFSIVTDVDGSDLYIEGVNVHIRNGAGSTGTSNGYGNLIVGYDRDMSNDDDDGMPEDRSGSHNVIVGDEHSYSSYGGLVVGFDNEISGEYASVGGGVSNLASGTYSSVSGGAGNVASGGWSSVSGGYLNAAEANFSSVSGGSSNTASGQQSSVSGGTNRDAPGEYDWAAGSLFEDL